MDNPKKKNTLRIDGRIEFPQYPKFKIGKPTSFCLTTCGYYTSLNAARKLLDVAYPVRMVADYLTGNAEKYGVKMGVANYAIVLAPLESYTEAHSTIRSSADIEERTLSIRARLFSLFFNKDGSIYKRTQYIYRKVKRFLPIILSKYNIKSYKKMDV